MTKNVLQLLALIELFAQTRWRFPIYYFEENGFFFSAGKVRRRNIGLTNR